MVIILFLISINMKNYSSAGYMFCNEALQNFSEMNFRTTFIRMQDNFIFLQTICNQEFFKKVFFFFYTINLVFCSHHILQCFFSKQVICVSRTDID